jgi:hypothetical protein
MWISRMDSLALGKHQSDLIVCIQVSQALTVRDVSSLCVCFAAVLLRKDGTSPKQKLVLYYQRTVQTSSSVHTPAKSLGWSRIEAVRIACAAVSEYILSAGATEAKRTQTEDLLSAANQPPTRCGVTRSSTRRDLWYRRELQIITQNVASEADLGWCHSPTFVPTPHYRNRNAIGEWAFFFRAREETILQSRDGKVKPLHEYMEGGQ